MMNIKFTQKWHKDCAKNKNDLDETDFYEINMDFSANIIGKNIHIYNDQNECCIGKLVSDINNVKIYSIKNYVLGGTHLIIKNNNIQWIAYGVGFLYVWCIKGNIN